MRGVAAGCRSDGIAASVRHVPGSAARGGSSAYRYTPVHTVTPRCVPLQLCSVLAVVYVYFAPLALANDFSNILDQYWSVMLRTMSASVLLGFAILGMNQTAAALEDPWRNSVRPCNGATR